MNILSFIDRIYESKYFTTALMIAIIILIILFVIVFILGVKDSKKSKMPSKKEEEELKDITFDTAIEKDVNKEDVTFETPVLTKNLEDFKKNLEEEIQKEQEVEVKAKVTKALNDATRPVKILDINLIEDTMVMSPIVNVPDDSSKDIVEKKDNSFENTMNVSKNDLPSLVKTTSVVNSNDEYYDDEEF